MPDTQPLRDPTVPANANYIFVEAPLTLENLSKILASIEASPADGVNTFNELYPTDSWIVHVYSAINSATNKKGYVILYSAPPDGATKPVQALEVTGDDDAAKADAASLLIGRGNELIGYEDFAEGKRVVIFRDVPSDAPAPSIPGRLSWETSDHPERRDWSSKLVALVSQNLARLEKGRPNDFIAGYDGLSDPMKFKFWAEMLVAMSKFESSWKPNDVYHESFGVNSVGLLQLSLQDQNSSAYQLVPHLNSEESLKDPLINLQWGVPIFTYWVERDKVVTKGSGDGSRGAARYWSVMRAGHKVELIQSLTKTNTGL